LSGKSPFEGDDGFSQIVPACRHHPGKDWIIGVVGVRREVPGSESLNASEAKSRTEAKGYFEISGLEKDSRGIWRGKGIMKDGRPVNVTLDLEGNIYSTLSRLYIRIEPPPTNR
jgi:hypothetical protein